jgi:hypothetical protein
MRWLRPFLAVSVTALTLYGQEALLGQPRREYAAELAKRIADTTTPVAERDSALAELERTDFSLALRLAPSLLKTEDSLMRLRASWILASGGQATGAKLLETAASARSDDSVVAIEMLGRLKDSTSHIFLRELLEKELEAPRDGSTRSRTFQLIQSLGDYQDKADASLLLKAVGSSSTNWLDAQALGMTGAAEAVPALDRIFTQTGKGWAVMAAGLGLARCGSQKGLVYVRRRLADTAADPTKPNDSYPTDADKDDPNGPKATDFIVTHLGVAADEVFVPDLLQVVSRSGSPDKARASAWAALLRINPTGYRAALLDLAWKNTSFEGAAKIIVLDDETTAQAFVAGSPADETYDHLLMRQLLGTDDRQRLRWRELHGYSF